MKHVQISSFERAAELEGPGGAIEGGHGKTTLAEVNEPNWTLTCWGTLEEAAVAGRCVSFMGAICMPTVGYNEQSR